MPDGVLILIAVVAVVIAILDGAGSGPIHKFLEKRKEKNK